MNDTTSSIPKRKNPYAQPRALRGSLAPACATISSSSKGSNLLSASQLGAVHRRDNQSKDPSTGAGSIISSSSSNSSSHRSDVAAPTEGLGVVARPPAPAGTTVENHSKENPPGRPGDGVGPRALAQHHPSSTTTPVTTTTASSSSKTAVVTTSFKAQLQRQIEQLKLQKRRAAQQKKRPSPEVKEASGAPSSLPLPSKSTSQVLKKEKKPRLSTASSSVLPRLRDLGRSSAPVTVPVSATTISPVPPTILPPLPSSTVQTSTPTLWTTTMHPPRAALSSSPPPAVEPRRDATPGVRLTPTTATSAAAATTDTVNAPSEIPPAQLDPPETEPDVEKQNRSLETPTFTRDDVTPRPSLHPEKAAREITPEGLDSAATADVQSETAVGGSLGSNRSSLSFTSPQVSSSSSLLPLGAPTIAVLVTSPAETATATFAAASPTILHQDTTGSSSLPMDLSSFSILPVTNTPATTAPPAVTEPTSRPSSAQALPIPFQPAQDAMIHPGHSWPPPPPPFLAPSGPLLPTTPTGAYGSPHGWAPPFQAWPTPMYSPWPVYPGGFSVSAAPFLPWHAHPAVLPLCPSPMMTTPAVQPPSRLSTAGAGFSFPAAKYGRSTAPNRPKVAEKLSPEIMTPPSPFAQTHVVLSSQVVLVKRPGDTSFGVTLHLAKESALVDPAWWLAHGSPSPKQAVSPSAPRSHPVVDTSPSVTASAPKHCEVTSNIVEVNEEAPPLTTMGDSTLQQAVAVSEGIQATPGTSTEKLANPPTETTIESHRKKRAPRRRRVVFLACMVLDASIQNQRPALSTDTNLEQLQPGDIVLRIDGLETFGRTFSEVCALIKNCQTKDDRGAITCPVLVARKKKVEPKVARPLLPKQPVNAQVSKPLKRDTRQGPLSGEEVVALAKCYLSATLDSRRTLGIAVSDELLEEYFQANPVLAGRLPAALKSAWRAVGRAIDQATKDAAQQFWKKKWDQQPETSKPAHLEFLSDAQRAALRAAPRPAKGCKCGSPSHSYVNDIACPLYANLRAIASSEKIDRDDGDEASPKLNLPEDLNAVETAFTNRFKRMQEEHAGDVAEAKFVEMMERIQIKKCNQAVFAPTLTTIVLSAVMELDGMAVETKKVSEVIKTAPLEVKIEKNAEESDDDDDIPLASLCKGSHASNTIKPSTKRNDYDVNLNYLQKLFAHVGGKWGHVYFEPSSQDYGWRWEVFHAQTSESVVNAHCKNPRKAGSCSLESARFIFSDSTSETLKSLGVATDHDLVLMAYALFPQRSGLFDEFLAMLQMDVIRLNEHGVAEMATSWWKKIDVLLLDDMQQNFGLEVDRTRRFGAPDLLQKALFKKWIATDYGWALTEDPDDIVFDYLEYEEWREAFEQKQQTHSDHTDGVGRFGI